MKSDTFRNEFKNCPVVYIAWDNQDIRLQKNFCRLLEILEVDVDKLQPIQHPTQFDKIILPDESYASHGLIRGFTNEYREMMNCVRTFALKNRTPTSSKKIYYFHGRRQQTGQERLAEYFKSKGYEIISPEKLTLDEQLNLLINCESFAATLGSCSHNSVFLRDGTETVFIPRCADRFWGYQRMMDGVSSQNANYIDSTLSIFGRIPFGPFCYIISEQLKRFFGDKFNGYEEEDFKIFLEYIKNFMSKGLEVNPNVTGYYGTILPDFVAQLNKHKNLVQAYDIPPCWEKFQSSINYQTHVAGKGWGAWNDDNQISNPLEQKLDIQAIKVSSLSYKIYYSVYYNDKEGWSEEVTSPNMAGTTGKFKSIFGIRILLDEAGTKKFDILYRVHKFDGTWTSWAKNGEAIYSDGIKLNAIQIKLEPKAGV